MVDNIKPHCAGPQHHLGGKDGWPQIEVKVTELPYNPEWPVRTIDAAAFCTYDCLADWAVERVQSRKPTSDDGEKF